MPKKLWGGRFSKKTDPLVEDFTKSIDYDYKLAKYDVVGSRIHIEILRKSKYLSDSEAKKLDDALGKIYDKIESGQFEIDLNCEDIHTNIQNVLESMVGDLVLKLHTARSRNDQVLFDLKMYAKFELSEVVELCEKLQKSLEKVGSQNKDIVIPGFTHLQHAQLVYLSDYLMSYSVMLKRDNVRLMNVKNSIKLSLGAGALSGTPIKAEIYNEAIKKFLESYKGFQEAFNVEQDVTFPQSLDTVSDRDFVIEILSSIAILGMHLSRMAEEIIIWTTKEFGFVEMDDAFSTGSSLMPQKKNPDVLELIRGMTGTFNGNLVNALTMMKALPLTYNRDMQLDKPALFNSLDMIKKELKVMSGLIETLKWNRKNIADIVSKDETIYATDLVYYLIDKGMPFKKAHDIIGKLVKYSIDKGVEIKKMADEDLRGFSDQLKHKEILKLMVPQVSVASRISVSRKQTSKK